MKNYIFIDSRAGDIDALRASLAADTVVVVLDPFQDGLTQIAKALSGVTSLDAIHIISHGAEGTLYLGSNVLNSENLGDYSSKLATIGAALSKEGDILLYGCEVASGSAGQTFIQQFAALSGADVAASNDYTGSAALGGDWVLDTTTGVIEAQALAPAEFAGLLAPPTLTPAGTLDKSFDVDGKVLTNISPIGNDDFSYSLVQQADGKLVAAGFGGNGFQSDFALVRYNIDGSLDSTFDGDGKVITALSTAQEQIDSIALQADGKIVAAGNVFTGVGSEFGLARYNVNGSLDTTFSGDGKLTTLVAGGGSVGTSVLLQADGKIVAAGYTNTSSIVFALARYNADGTLDSSFDFDGKLTTAIGTYIDIVRDTVLLPDGRILVGGYSWNGSNNDFALVRYNSDGTLDSSFDSDGKLTTAIGTGDDVMTSLTLQADGKIVVGGSSSVNTNGLVFALARHNPDGSFDTTFDGDGKVTSAIGTFQDQINSLALQADGRIVVAGYTNTSGNFDFALARYNVDGSLDTAFDGDGKFVPPAFSNALANSVIVQSDGAIVAGGFRNSDFALVRVVGGGTVADSGIPDVTAAKNALFSFTFNANAFTDPEGNPLTFSVGALPGWLSFDAATRTFSGTPGSADVGSATAVTVFASDAETFSVSDTFTLSVQNNEAPALIAVLDNSFDGDGKVVTSITPNNDIITSMALLADGRIMVAGYSGAFPNEDFALARYNANGSLDTTFDSDGKVTTAIGTGSDVINGMAMQADGKIVAAGATYNGFDYDFAVARYTTNGSLDTTFDTDGKLTLQIGTSADVINSVALQADGKIVAAGNSSNGTNVDFALARINTNGSLDTTFDGDGKLITAFGAADDLAQIVAIQADGRIVVAGSTLNAFGGYVFALARYNTNGSLDTTFDGDGKVTTAIGTLTDQTTSLVIQANGKIVVAGSSFSGSTADFALARYNTNGSLDSTFDDDGKLTTAFGTGTSGINSLALQADGRTIAAGFSNNGGGVIDFALARYGTDGSLDTTFDVDGKLTAAIGARDDIANSIKIQSDGSIVAAGYATDSNGLIDFALIRVPATPGTTDKTSVHSTPMTHAINPFTDPEGGQLVYSATLADGSPLPGWLGFANAAFSGTPAQSQVGRYDIVVTAKDIWGAAASDAFSLAITNVSGTSGNDTLYGGLGADTMTGLAGNDVYTVDNAGDRVTEALNGGTDVVRASVTYTLDANVETLVLTGSGNLNGTGNALSNSLFGNNGTNTLDGGAGDDTMDGFGGTDTVSYASAGAGITANLATGSASDGQGGSDLLISIENIIGSGFNDTLRGDPGDNSLNGGAGIDTVIYTGAFRQSVLNGNPVTHATFTGPDGADTLISIESLKFIDGIRSYDAGAHIWQAERLYGSAFDRPADALGRNFHSARLDIGTNLATVAQDFAASAEFVATYGSLNNTGFVNQMYLNVLNRPADPGGLTYWTGLLNGGSTRGDVLMGFSESPENIGNYAGQLVGGLWDIDETAASVARLYHGTLDRTPEVGGLSYWTDQLKTGAQTLPQAAAGFVASPEFQGRYGSLDNTQFVNQLYLNVLDRPGEPGGLAYWTGLLNGGSTRADVALGFTESFEFQVNMLGQIENGIVVI